MFVKELDYFLSVIEFYFFVFLSWPIGHLNVKIDIADFFFCVSSVQWLFIRRALDLRNLSVLHW